MDLQSKHAELRQKVAAAVAGRGEKAAAAVLKSFDSAAKHTNARYFDSWAQKQTIDWHPIVDSLLGTNVAADLAGKVKLFGTFNKDRKLFEGGRMAGVPTTGFSPVDPTTSATKLTTVPRRGAAAYDYTASDDTRTLQLLRQVSTQFYLYLESAQKLAKDEQEIQTMLAYGNLLVGSNQIETAQNLYQSLMTLQGTATTSDVVHSILTGAYGGGALKTLSKRHGDKLATLYQGVRQVRVTAPKVQEVLDRLVQANVLRITDLADAAQTQRVADTAGAIFVLAAPSLTGVSHAEQRLIELRNIVELYKTDPTAWVAGKKRPCFGCWLHERLRAASAPFQLIYQDQPGKAFMNTYFNAAENERQEWHKTLDAHDDFTVYESDTLGGRAGPESDSEAEEELPEFDDENTLAERVADKPLKPAQRGALKRHWDAAGGDFDATETYLRQRQAGRVDPGKEDQVEREIRQLRLWARQARNPAVKKKYRLDQPYKKRKTDTGAQVTKV